MRKWESSNLKNGWDRGDSVPGAFKLDHLQSFKSLLFWKFSNFFTFILGGQFLLPQRTNNCKRGIFKPRKWVRQYLPRALKLDHLQLIELLLLWYFPQLMQFYAMEQSIVLPPRGPGNNGKREFFGVPSKGIQTGPKREPSSVSVVVARFRPCSLASPLFFFMGMGEGKWG